jgi:hypothetical protein
MSELRFVVTPNSPEDETSARILEDFLNTPENLALIDKLIEERFMPAWRNYFLYGTPIPEDLLG